MIEALNKISFLFLSKLGLLIVISLVITEITSPFFPYLPQAPFHISMFLTELKFRSVYNLKLVLTCKLFFNHVWASMPKYNYYFLFLLLFILKFSIALMRRIHLSNNFRSIVPRKQSQSRHNSLLGELLWFCFCFFCCFVLCSLSHFSIDKGWCLYLVV